MSSIAMSQIQQLFHKNEIYKRSRRYFDVIKLKSIQNNGQKYRRKPQDNHKQIQQKYQNSFISSQDLINKKRIKQIQNIRQKRSLSSVLNNNDKSSSNIKDSIVTQTQTNYSSHTRTQKKLQMNLRQLKAPDMNKSLPREFYQKLFYHDNHDNSQFFLSVNSDFQKGQNVKTIDFNKIKGRQNNNTNIKRSLFFKDNNNNNDEQLNPEKASKNQLISQRKLSRYQDKNKIYQKLYFDQSTFKCLFDVEKSRKAENKKTIIYKTNQIRQINLDRLQKGSEFTSKKLNKSNLMFYHGKGKQQPSQLEIRTLKRNQNYWMDELKRMKKQDFQIAKRKQQMDQKRLQKYIKNKSMIDQRGQICDTKFFLRMKQRQKRQKQKIKQRS